VGGDEVSDDRVASLRGALARYEAAVRRRQEKLDAIDALHQPHLYIDGVCRECDNYWPCDTHLLLHPEDGDQ
jgi:hypothetical protein